MRLTEVAHVWLAEIIEAGDAVIDATLGNGFDALFLAQQVKESGHVFGFDVQEQAVITSQKLLQNQPCQQHLFLAGHEHMLENIPATYHGNIKAIMFNLGWLPNSDKSIITTAETTIQALAQSLDLLAHHGRLTVMAYPGHQGGSDETTKVINWLKQTCTNNKTYHYHAIILPNRPTAPILIQVEKRK